MSKHTPGPWTLLTKEAKCVFPVYARGENISGVVASVNTGWPHPVQVDEQIANARLIAAAPELLASLQEISRLDNADRIAACSTGEAVTTYAFQDAMARVDAAIAKATGAAA